MQKNKKESSHGKPEINKPEKKVKMQKTLTYTLLSCRKKMNNKAN